MRHQGEGAAAVVAIVIACTVLVSCENSVSERASAERSPTRSLNAALAFTDQLEDFDSKWTQPVYEVPVATITQAETGAPFMGFVTFSGCTPDERELCNVIMEPEMLGPDGSVVLSPGPAEAWIGKPPPEPGTIQLAIAGMDLVFEPGDPTGTYTLVVSIHDRNADVRTEIRGAIAHVATGSR